MLYELIAVVRAGNINYVKDVARTTGTYILGNRGTIRSLNNYGIFDLPKPTVKYQTQHHKGHYFTLTFDSSSKVQDEVRRQLGLNPHMVRFSVVKIGDKLGGRRNQTGKIEDVTGKMEWSDMSNTSLFDVSAMGEAARANERVTDGILPVSSAGSSQQPMNW